MTPRPAFTYAATVRSVYDGDTIKVDIDLGFSVHLHTSARLLGCNAIELSQPGGVEARDNLRALLPTGTVVTLRSVLVDKFGGRVDAQVTLPDGTDLVTGLIAAGWAAVWSGAGPRPVPAWPRPWEVPDDVHAHPG